MILKGLESREEREKMTNDELYEYVQNNKYRYDIKITRKEFTEDIYIGKKYESLAGGIWFTDCIFQGIEIRDVSFSKSIKFYGNCNGEYLEIENCNIGGDYSLRGNFENISFIKTSIKRVDIIASNIKNTLYFEECKLEEVELNTSIINSIVFSQTDINLLCELDQIINNDEVAFEKGKLKKLKLCSSQLGSLSFQDSIFQDKCDLFGLIIKSSLSINDCNFKKQVTFDNNQIYLNFIKKFNERELLPSEITIQKSFFEEGLFLTHQLYLTQDKPIEIINVLLSSNLIGNIAFSNFPISNIHVTGFNSKANLVFKNIEANSFELKDVSNYTNIKIHNLSPLQKNSSFKIIDSIIGKTDFFNVDFTKFALLFKDSQLTDATFTNVDWPESIPISDKEEKNYKPTEHKKQMIMYRQLKQVMKRQGDRPKALDFERLEWRAYKKSIVPTWKNLGDRIILWTNQSNNFRENWWKPIFLMLAFTAFFYSMMIFCSLKIKQPCVEAKFFDCWGFFKAFGTHLKVYLHLLNPIHRVSDYSEGFNDDTSTVLFDTFSRLFNGYFIFQSVRAFRKFIG